VSSPHATSEEAVAFLLYVCEREEQRRRAWFRVGNLLTAVLLLAWGTVSTFALVTHTRWFGSGTISIINLVIQGAHLTLRGVFGWTPKRSPLLLRAAVALAETDDPRALGPLIDALPRRTAETQGVLLSALTHRLWALPADALALDETRRAVLRADLLARYPVMWTFRRRPVTDFTDSIADSALAELKALALVGDPKARRVMQVIINAPASTENERLVQSVAQECLHLLDEQLASKATVRQRLNALLVPGSQLDAATFKAFLQDLEPTHATEALMDVWRRHKVRYGLVRGALCLGGLSWVGVLAALDLASYGSSFQLFLATFIRACLILTVIYFWRWPTLPTHQRAVFSELAQYDDPRLLGTLLEIRVETGSPDFNDAITRLLQQIRPGDGALLAPQHRALLRRALGERHLRTDPRRHSTTFTVAALDALGAVGDGHTFKVAQLLADHARRRTVREAARRCVERLREFQEATSRLRTRPGQHASS
jgi:hypothetical protein